MNTGTFETGTATRLINRNIAVATTPVTARKGPLHDPPRALAVAGAR